MEFLHLRLGLLLCAAALGACGSRAPAATPRTETSLQLIAASGLVEPNGEERILIPEIGGRLAHVYIHEGDTVKAGQVLAEIANGEYAGALAAAQAALALREAELARLKNGARNEERQQSRAALDSSIAAEQLADGELERRKSMWDKKQISREVVDQARNAAAAANARRRDAEARWQMIEKGARSEDLAIAQAAVAAARGDLDRASALFEKTRIRAPVDGVVLKRDLREGETVVALSPIPLARIGDTSKLYVRAEIDELDVARVKAGQRASISADAFPNQRIAGVVETVSRRMGRRSILADDPTRKTDTQVLEVRIALDAGAELPIGLRVDVRIDAR